MSPFWTFWQTLASEDLTEPGNAAESCDIDWHSSFSTAAVTPPPVGIDGVVDPDPVPLPPPLPLEPIELQALWAAVNVAPLRPLSLRTSLQTCLAAAWAPAASPDAAFSHADSSWLFSAEVSVGAAAMLDLHAATIDATCGDAAVVCVLEELSVVFDELAVVFDVLVELLAAACVEEADVELLLLPPPPQPAMNTPTTSATAHRLRNH